MEIIKITNNPRGGNLLYKYFMRAKLDHIGLEVWERPKVEINPQFGAFLEKMK